MANNTLANSYTATGAATALSRGMSPERFSERAAAYAQTEQSNQDLRTLRATEPTEKDRETMAQTQSVELQNALAVQQEMLRDNNKRTTFSAYERYDASGDVRHLNTMLTDLNKNGSQLFGQIARVDKITENDRQMLTDMGIPPSYVDAIINDPKVNQSYVLYTKKDGTKEFGDLDALKGLTDYNLYATDKEIARQTSAATLAQISALGYPLDNLSTEAFRRAQAEQGVNFDPKSNEFQELYSKHYDELVRNKRAGRNNVNVDAATGSSDYYKGYSGEEGYARRHVEKVIGLEEGDEGYHEAVLAAQDDYANNRHRPAAVRKDEYAAGAEEILSEMGFMDMDLNNISETERVKIEQQIRKIEGPGGQELSIEDRKTLARIRKLTTLGDVAAGLTDDQTGALDSLVRRVKKYVSDDLEGVDAESAYQSFRNLVLHSFYGSALTPTEAENLQKAFGSLAQQRGPVIQQLKTTMLEIKDAYEAIEATNNPMVTKWRAGSTGADLYAVMDSIDERLDYLNRVQKGEIVPFATDGPVDRTNKATVIRPESRSLMDGLSGKTTTGAIDED